MVKALSLILLFGIVTFCLIASFRFIEVKSTLTLLIFSFLFGSITFLLDGAFGRKIGLLAVGNLLGLFWNFIFHSFSSAGSLAFGKVFEVVYLMIFPFLNMLWIISFWSLSMAYLSKTNSNRGLSL